MCFYLCIIPLPQNNCDIAHISHAGKIAFGNPYSAYSEICPCEPILWAISMYSCVHIWFILMVLLFVCERKQMTRKQTFLQSNITTYMLSSWQLWSHIFQPLFWKKWLYVYLLHFFLPGMFLLFIFPLFYYLYSFW